MKNSLFVLSMIIWICAVHTFAQQTSNIQYDNLYRLQKIDYGNGSIINYTYDANGNRLTEVITSVSLPSAPILSSPANNSTNVQLSPILIWQSVSGALSYRIQVSMDSLFGIVNWDSLGITNTSTTIPFGKLNGLTKYFWRVQAVNQAGAGSYSNVWSFRTSQYLPLSLKLYLEGFWNGNSMVSDTIQVFLSNVNTPGLLTDTISLVASTTGTANAYFSKAANGNYYIVVSHRNHLRTWSGMPQSFTTGNLVSYDFTTDSTKAYGNNMKKLGNSWMIIGGDPNSDGSIDAIDIGLFVTQFGNQGYLSCDFNGDQDVNASDVQIIVSNFGLTSAIPTASKNIDKQDKNKTYKIYNNEDSKNKRK